jgi:cytochrome c biogenesis protein CcmG/thiol:disulfide interchange protein DsbE
VSRQRLVGLALVAVAALVLIVDAAGVARNWAAFRPVRAGDLAPDFRLPRVDARGELAAPLSLAELRGKVVVLDFWATWCGPCRASMPVLDRVVARHAARGAVLVSINTEGPDARGEARTMVDELAPGATLVSDDGATSDRYRVTTIPHLVVVDRDGRVVLVSRGFPGQSRLERELSQALDQALR